MEHPHAFLLLLLIMASSVIATADDPFVGVVVNTKVRDPPSPVEIQALLASRKIRHVRLLDADPSVMVALANTGVELTVTLESTMVPVVASSSSAALDWVSANLSKHLPQTKVVAVCVGDEVLADGSAHALVLSRAFDRLHSAVLSSSRTSHIKISTPVSFSLIRDWYPPSLSHFNRSSSDAVRRLLGFLAATASPFMLDAYPYYEYLSAAPRIPLDLALSREPASHRPAADPATGLNYTDLFDVMVDAAYSAMADLGFTNVSVMVTETGWPWAAADATREPDATPENAFVYNRNLIRKVMRRRGTPLRPGAAMRVFVEQLYDDGGRGRTGGDRFGVFHPNGTTIVPLSINGSGMPKAGPAGGPSFCVAVPGEGDVALQVALDWACGTGGANCSALHGDGPCSLPNTKASRASYAFNDYYQRHRNDPDACDFGGTARLVSSDPSYGRCVYTGSNGAKMSVNGTVSSDKPVTSTAAAACCEGYLVLVFFILILL